MKMNTFENIRKTGAAPAVTRKLSNRDKQLYSFSVNRDGIIKNTDWRKVKKEIVSRLETACMIAGTPQECIPNEAGFKKMADIIAENFGYLHADEISFAFELAFLGVLNLTENQVSNLGFFDMPWVTTIIRAYLVYRTERVGYVKKLIQNETAIRVQIEKRIQQNEETIRALKGFFDMYIRYGGFSVGNVPEHVHPSFVFLFLEYVGLIRISDEAKQTLFDAAFKEVLPDVVKDPAMWKDNPPRPLTSFETRITTYKAQDLLRYRAILVLFEKWKKEGKTPETIYKLFKNHFCSFDPNAAIEAPGFNQAG